MHFSEFNLSKPLNEAMLELGFEQATPIQIKAFPAMMEGKDMIGIAQTGTGKTLAYLLPLLHDWKYSKDRHPKILILVPTRELAKQVKKTVDQLTEYMSFESIVITGGANINVQAEDLRGKLDMVIATPGRIIDLMMDGNMKTNVFKKVVIDEMDEMLNLGFVGQLTDIIDLLQGKKQYALFSATYHNRVKSFIESFFPNAKTVEAAPPGTPLEEITQVTFEAPNFFSKINLINHLLEVDEDMNKVLIFCSGRKVADYLYSQLSPNEMEQFDVIHSNKSLNYRLRVIDELKNGQLRGLIATDVVARGMDIQALSHVVNFDMHQKAENYIHRIGRTGRAGQKGIAISFLEEKDESVIAQLEELMGMPIPRSPFPEGVTISEMKAPHEIEADVEDVGPIEYEGGGAFHEKKAKNLKVNKRKSRSSVMRAKYKKPQKRKPKTKR